MTNKRQASRLPAKSSIFVNEEIETFLNQFSQFVQRHLNENKSETVLVAGPPSCGKTKLLEEVFLRISRDDPSNNERLVIFRLHGLIHSVESSAVREIIDQYKLKRKTNEEFLCDNLQILLETIGNERKNENLYFVFVLDHFEQFTYQKLNSILYTLFDAVYSGKKSYSILTIALSNRADCLELPEKRLKSRFSQIYFILSSPPVNDYLQYLGQIYKTKNIPKIDDDRFNSLKNIEQKFIHFLRDQNADLHEDHRLEQRIDGSLTHLELLLLLMSHQVIQRMEEKAHRRINDNNDTADDEDNDDDEQQNGGILTDSKFTFDQLYHEYSKYILKNQKYSYEKSVVRKVSCSLIIETSSEGEFVSRVMIHIDRLSIETLCPTK